jgi:hypothetical protein
MNQILHCLAGAVNGRLDARKLHSNVVRNGLLIAHEMKKIPHGNWFPRPVPAHIDGRRPDRRRAAPFSRVLTIAKLSQQRREDEIGSEIVL